MLHREGMQGVVDRFTEIQSKMLTDEAPQMRILRGSAPILSAHAQTKSARAYVTDTELLDLCDELGICSAMYLPLAARDRVLGCLTLVSGRSGRIFGEDDLEFAADLARRSALVVDNTTLYEREHRVAHLLQTSLLPTLPTIDDLDVAARYLPSDRSAEVGGDFYDVMLLPGGAVGLAVGDVVGHDLHAAAVMGQLRVLLRAASWQTANEGQGPAPGVVLLDRYLQALNLTTFATLFFAQTERQPGGSWTLTYTLAGHPAPLLRLPSGEIVELDQARSVALGVVEDVVRASASIVVPPGSALIAFTDGLVERRNETWTEMLGRVRSAIDHVPVHRSAAALADAIVEEAADDRFDDIALLVVRFA
jgi:serine phosphatase RsbU (regulator of sigma subunit)